MSEKKNALVHFGRRSRGVVMPSQVIKQKSEQFQNIKTNVFPPDLETHGFCMNFVDYHFTDGSGQVEGASEITESFLLPLPGQGISDKQMVKYNEGELGQVGGALSGTAGGAGKLMNDVFGMDNTSVDTIEAGATEIVKGLTATGLVASRLAIETLSKGTADAIGLVAGNVINPRVALLFQNVGLKTFSFTWKLSPRNKDESDLLRDFIIKLRKNTHPSGVKEGGGSQTDATNFFLDYPNQVDLYYVGVQDYFHYFKRAAVTEMEVNYQPEGGTLLNAGTGAPTVIDLTIGFQETEIWTAEDYMDLESKI